MSVRASAKIDFIVKFTYASPYPDPRSRASSGGVRKAGIGGGNLRAVVYAILTHGRPREKPSRDTELLVRPDR